MGTQTEAKLLSENIMKETKSLKKILIYIVRYKTLKPERKLSL